MFLSTLRGNMSRLIEELKRRGRAVPQPMGFKTSRPAATEPRILLIAGVTPGGDANGLADGAEGADAVLFHLAKAQMTAKTLQKMAKSLPDLPWGVWVEDTSAEKIGTLAEAGGDFVVFPPAVPVASIPQDGKMGTILQVEPSLGDGLLRAVNDLPVDGVLATGVEAGEPLAWRHLMLWQRLSNLLSKPFLVKASLAITADELKTLWDTGVDGVVIDAGTAPAGGLKELRQAIGRITFRSSRKRGRAEALLPRLSTAPEAEPGPDEEEDE
jgi:hypothetical protein